MIRGLGYFMLGVGLALITPNDLRGFIGSVLVMLGFILVTNIPTERS